MSKLFPEVDDGEAPSPVHRSGNGSGSTQHGGGPSHGNDGKGLPVGAPVTRAPVSPRALAIYDRVFGLPGRFKNASGECHVRSVMLIDGERIEFTVGGGPVPESTFFVLAGHAEHAIARTMHLSLVARGKDVAPSTQYVLRQVAHRIHEGTMALLARPLSAYGAKIAPESEGPEYSAEAPADGLPMPHMSWPPTDVDEEYLNSLGFGYSPPGAWRNFLQGHENNYGGIENTRGYCQRMAGHVVNVNHTEIECYYSSPTHRNGSVGFWNHAAALPFEQQADESHLELFSDLSDMDVIKGGTHKLNRLLDALVESGHKTDMVVLTSTCTTTVIGDDTVGSTERLKKKSPLRVLNMHESRDIRSILFDEIRSKPEFLTVPKRPGSVNLVGFPKLAGHQDFVALLEESGAALNSWVLPEVNARQLERYMAADLQVFYDWQFLDASYKTLFGSITLPQVRPPVPYGIDGTRRALTAIAEAFGKPTMFEAAWNRRIAQVQPEWDALVREARGYRLGFVGEEKTLAGFFATRQILGIPVLPLLEEMGFGIDLYLTRTKGPTVPEPREDGGRRTRYFASPEELEEILRESDTAAFYTELYFDRRITRSSKNSFSINDFGRLGLEGSLESLRRLVAACRLPFFRTYGRYLGRPFAVGSAAGPRGTTP